ncbi:MAG: TonB-dependent receptor, partial [Bacteroidales bacterium]
AYGYTHAAFRDNNNGKVSYAGNYVPFSPKHTLSLDATYIIDLPNCWLDAITINAGMIGRGRIYWTEANDVWQNFYGLLNANIGLRKKYVELSVWGKNLTNANYQSFYFETMSATNVMSQTGFMEQGRPITFGVDINVSF